MKFLKHYEQFVLQTVDENDSLEESTSNIEIDKKKKTKKDAQEEEDEAFKKVAAGFISENPLSKE